MQPIFSKFASLFMLSSVLAVTACASTSGGPSDASPGRMMRGQGGGSMMGGSGSGGNMMGGTSSDRMGMGHMDRNSMCATYRQMQSARTPEERQAIMNERMPGMSPEMQQQRMQMMQQQCQ